MKTPFVYPFVIAFMSILAVGNSDAQDMMGGRVKYQQITKYNFEAIFEADAMERVKEYLGGTIPKEGKNATVLYFREETALYGEDPAEKEALPRKLQGVLARANYMKPPQPELKKVFYDFGKNKKLSK